MSAVRLLLALLLLLAAPAAAQTFPDRQVRIVMPWPPGGGTDLLARAFGARMQEAWGQPVVVDNRAGANGIIGSQEAARARPDGYTILMATADTHGINPAVRRGLPYDAARDFVPVIWISTQPLSLCVRPSLAAPDLAAFVALARARPGTVTYASWGAGSTAHMAMELFRLRAGFEATHVPYRGAAPALTDLVAGQVDSIFTGPLSSRPYVERGQMRCLGTAAATRPASLPDFPAFAEVGYPGVEVQAWYGLVAPAGTPAGPLAELRRVTALALADPGVRERMATIGMEPVGGDPERFAAHIRDEIEKWSQVTRAANIVVE